MIIRQRQTNRLPSSPATAGFTLIEVLVVVIMVAILMAIASPGWLAFANRQRVNSVRDAALNTLRTAQVQAQQRRETQTVSVSNDDGIPTLIVNGQRIVLSGEGVPAGFVELSVFALVLDDDGDRVWEEWSEIRFNYQGTVEGLYKIEVEPTSGGETRCVVITSILGGMKTVNGSDCDLT